MKNEEKEVEQIKNCSVSGDFFKMDGHILSAIFKFNIWAYAVSY